MHTDAFGVCTRVARAGRWETPGHLGAPAVSAFRAVYPNSAPGEHRWRSLAMKQAATDDLQISGL